MLYRLFEGVVGLVLIGTLVATVWLVATGLR